jgi:four helix bundle protein
MANPKAEELKKRTNLFAVAVCELCRCLPPGVESRRIAPQLVDSATSVRANYRATCKARSRAEFAAKIGVVAGEADESEGWLALLLELKLGPADKVEALRSEANELTAIFTASFRTARGRLHKSLNPHNKSRNPQ